MVKYSRNKSIKTSIGGQAMTKRQLYEAKGMVHCILEGNSEIETAESYGVSVGTVRNRLKSMGYTAEELIELRESRKMAKQQNKKQGS